MLSSQARPWPYLHLIPKGNFNPKPGWHYSTLHRVQNKPCFAQIRGQIRADIGPRRTTCFIGGQGQGSVRPLFPNDPQDWRHNVPIFTLEKKYPRRRPGSCHNNDGCQVSPQEFLKILDKILQRIFLLSCQSDRYFCRQPFGYVCFLHPWPNLCAGI